MIQIITGKVFEMISVLTPADVLTYNVKFMTDHVKSHIIQYIVVLFIMLLCVTIKNQSEFLH